MTKRVLLALAVVLGALLVGAPTAAATTYAHPGMAHKHPDNIWGGYVATGTSYKTVTAAWVNPSVDCSAGGIGSWWVGFDGWNTNTVEQIGVDADCTSGSLSYNPWWEMYPRNSHYFADPTHVGDHMTATVTHNSGTSYTLTMSDTTTNWTKTVTASLSGALNDGAEVMVEPIGSATVPLLPNFHNIQFTGVAVDGKAMGGVSTIESTLGRGNTVLATTSALSGSSFSLAWLHN
jgi:hypothetical protein